MMMESTKLDMTNLTPNQRNLINIYSSLYSWEQKCGLEYYHIQRDRIRQTLRASGCRTTLEAAVAAFAVLSPNNHEITNHIALDKCLRISSGELHKSTRVPAYGKNKTKALTILERDYLHLGELDPSQFVLGQKVFAFYHNTLHPNDDTYLTVDGHMHSVWIGRRLMLKREAEVSKEKYKTISNDIRLCAQILGVLATGFQAGLWIGWRRMIAAPNQPWLELW